MTTTRKKNELEELQKELKAKQAEKEYYEKLKHAKLRLLNEKVTTAPARLAAKHPILVFLTQQGYAVGKKIGHGAVSIVGKVTHGTKKYSKKVAKKVAKESKKTAKETMKDIKEATKILGEGAVEFARYAAEKKAQQYERAGNYELANKIRERLERTKKHRVKT